MVTTLHAGISLGKGDPAAAAIVRDDDGIGCPAMRAKA